MIWRWVSRYFRSQINLQWVIGWSYLSHSQQSIKLIHLMHDKLEYEARYLPSLCHNASVNIFHSKERQHRDDSIFVGKKSQWLKRCRSSWKLTLSCYGIYQDISILDYTLARTVLLQYFHRHIGCFSFYFDFFFFDVSNCLNSPRLLVVVSTRSVYGYHFLWSLLGMSPLRYYIFHA